MPTWLAQLSDCKKNLFFSFLSHKIVFCKLLQLFDIRKKRKVFFQLFQLVDTKMKHNRLMNQVLNSPEGFL